MSTLLLRMVGPLQAWGIDSKFETRRTGREPSKSGVIGMLAAAMGLRRDADLSDFYKLRFGVRVDREGTVIRDFHTVKGDKTNYITYRDYLSDAAFLVGLESEDEEFLSELQYAVTHPAYPLFLGRRSCVPAVPIFAGIKDKTIEDVFNEEPCHGHSGRTGNKNLNLRVVIDCDPDDKQSAYIRDIPITFNPEKRQYGFRSAKEYMVDLKKVDFSETEHDAMSEL